MVRWVSGTPADDANDAPLCTLLLYTCVGAAPQDEAAHGGGGLARFCGAARVCGRSAACAGAAPFLHPAPPHLSLAPSAKQETKLVFEKLYKFIGKNIKALIDRPEDPCCFRLQKNRVYYVREKIMKKSTNVRGLRPETCCMLPPCAHGVSNSGPRPVEWTTGSLSLASPSHLFLDLHQPCVCTPRRLRGTSSCRWAPASAS